MSQQSIADLFVETLGKVQRMSDGIGLEHPERHAIREMKQAAEQVLADACRVAQRIVWAAGSTREAVAKAAATPASQPSTDTASGRAQRTNNNKED
ncbi:hypothetical protein [Massilia sp. UBA6681]|uniref:hypothetical protein n=1 Tax=Massilia sp. UBA6681 TaxID=1946839 RepID=UPI0025B7E581|nr:hypothetical protein [Massilia sp. UBA6681]